MKIAILGDTHFGVRGDSIKFHDYYRKFYENEFFPYLEKNNITNIYQLGDLFDRRKYINFNTLALAKDYFFDRIALLELKLFTLLGNHDIFWKESLEVNSTGLVLGEYKEHITLIDTPTKIEIDNTTIDMIPWICKENQQEVFEYIDQSKSDLCFGHFEIAGFPMYKGMVGNHGLSHEMFAKYERVLSGHYHTRSKQENIEYVGTPYEMTWQDYNDPRGFSIFDTETRELEFIKNPYTIHEKIAYDDKNQDPIDLSQIDIKDKYVKVAVINKTDLYKFDQFINELYTKDAYEIKIIEDFSEFTNGEISTDINIEDTMSILSNYVDSVETDENKEEIKSVLKELYLEAINQEVV